MHAEQQLLNTEHSPFPTNGSYSRIFSKNGHKTETLHGLIDKARSHSLGMDFFRDGYLEAVAIIFETDVFEVEAARALLNTQPREVYDTSSSCNCM